jgi:hypothetical protein
MQIQKLILALMMISVAHAEDEPSCMDKAQYLAVGLKLTEHLLYMVEHVNAGKGSVDELCAQPFRTKYYEADLVKFNVPLIQARKDLDERGVTSSKNFPFLRRNKVEMLTMQQVCQLVETHLAKNNRCMEPRNYMQGLITKKIFSNPFEQNCSKYLPDVVQNVRYCLTKK